MKVKKIAALIAVICLIAVIAVGLTACKVNPDTQVQEFTLQKDVVRVGIISDSQLAKTDGENEYQNSLIRALSVLKARGADVILFAGDITDLSKAKAYDLYNEAYDKVFGDNRPIVQTIMGNHDYWGNGAAGTCRRLFEKKIGHSPWTHYVVNGYHFIGASPDSGSMDKGYKNLKQWLRTQIDKAVADDPDKPVFVMTHNGARDTSYGTDEWGDDSLGEVLKDYDNVVSISGHSHYSVLDERTIHQGDYTSIATQSVSYTELETGKVNGTIPPNASATPMGYVMDIYSNRVQIQRVNFSVKYGETGFDEKQPWVLPIPLKKDTFTYNASRADLNAAPVMSSESGISYKEGDTTILEFDAGSDDDFVHSYKIVWSDGSEQLYFSDFYNGLSDMSAKVKINVKKSKGNYSASIYAVDSWGAVSANFVNISGIAV